MRILSQLKLFNKFCNLRKQGKGKGDILFYLTFLNIFLQWGTPSLTLFFILILVLKHNFVLYIIFISPSWSWCDLWIWFAVGGTCSLRFQMSWRLCIIEGRLILIAHLSWLFTAAVFHYICLLYTSPSPRD